MQEQSFYRPKAPIYDANVLSNQPFGSKFHRLILQLDGKEGGKAFSEAIAGQFAELDLSGLALPALPVNKDIPPAIKDRAERHIILRRPFSFCNIVKTDCDTVNVEILYCVLGPATLRMTTLKEGDTISIIGPLGNGFNVPDDTKLAILVSGGMGAPPLLHLAKFLKSNFPQIDVIAFAGVKSRDELPVTVVSEKEQVFIEQFKHLGISSYIATDDGSIGYKGFVTNCLAGRLEEMDVTSSKTIIYACGPEAMLAAVASLAAKYGISCQVSMERMMACGIGLCQSCAVEVNSGAKESIYKLCCKDGPVFDGSEVIFNR